MTVTTPYLSSSALRKNSVFIEDAFLYDHLRGRRRYEFGILVHFKNLSRRLGQGVAMRTYVVDKKNPIILPGAGSNRQRTAITPPEGVCRMPTRHNAAL